MATENKKTLQAALAHVMKHWGYKKTGATWRKEFLDSIAVLNVQGSQWSEVFYIKLGIYFRALGPKEAPNEYDCHLRCHFADLVPDRRRYLELLDFEKPADVLLRSEEVRALVELYALPWLERCSSFDGAAAYVCASAPNSAWITDEAKDYFRLKSS